MSVKLGLDSWTKSEWHGMGLDENGRRSLQQFRVDIKASAACEVSIEDRTFVQQALEGTRTRGHVHANSV